jgi:hypothetical protein
MQLIQGWPGAPCSHAVASDTTCPRRSPCRTPGPWRVLHPGGRYSWPELPSKGNPARTKGPHGQGANNAGCEPPQPPLPNSDRAHSPSSPHRRKAGDLADELDREAILVGADFNAVDEATKNLESLHFCRGIDKRLLQAGDLLPIEFCQLGWSRVDGAGAPSISD